MSTLELEEAQMEATGTGTSRSVRARVEWAECAGGHTHYAGTLYVDDISDEEMVAYARQATAVVVALPGVMAVYKGMAGYRLVVRSRNVTTEGEMRETLDRIAGQLQLQLALEPGGENPTILAEEYDEYQLIPTVVLALDVLPQTPDGPTDGRYYV